MMFTPEICEEILDKLCSEGWGTNCNLPLWIIPESNPIESSVQYVYYTWEGIDGF
jgi:hypothetical protein